MYPWPVNLLHHYVLKPNISYIPGLSNDVDPENRPYFCNSSNPMLLRTIASPINLFSTSHMALGDYGTAIWLDSHTEEYFDSVKGKRLAGRLLPLYDDANDDATAVASSSAGMVFGIQEDDSWVRVALDEQEGRIAIGTDTGSISILEFA